MVRQVYSCLYDYLWIETGYSAADAGDKSRFVLRRQWLQINGTHSLLVVSRSGGHAERESRTQPAKLF